jgi:hypothetical protein
MLTEVETLHPIEVRVLGALLEKDIATPEYYPLTVNSLQNACNQKSNREPVVSGAGHRVEKYGHRLGEKLNLGRRELALLCILMLRGAQTVGELRGRTERMHDFADMDEVERVLETLASHDPDPLVARAPRGRWVQLLGGPPDLAAEPEPVPIVASRGSQQGELEARIATLEREVEDLKRQFENFRHQFE